MKRLVNVLFRRSVAATFCDSCGSVCDSACRSNALLGRARTTALASAPRF